MGALQTWVRDARRRRAVRAACALVLMGAATAGAWRVVDVGTNDRPRDATAPYFYASLHPESAPTSAEVLPLTFDYDGRERAARLEVDATGLAGVARIAGGADACRPRTPVFSCDFHLHPDAQGWNRQELVVKPAAGARPGDAGMLRYTLDAEGMPPVHASVTVIAGRPELRVAEGEPVARQAVGEAFEVPVLVRNVGDVPAHGVVLFLDGDGDLAAAARRTGCRYAAHGTAVSCELPDAEVAPGATVRVTPVPRLTADADALDAHVGYLAWASRERPYRALPPGRTERGTDAPFRLAPVPDPPARTAFTDTQDPATLSVPVRNQAGFEAFGATVSGAVGSEHEVTVGVRNNGPAEPNAPDVRAVFTVPPGAKVVRAPHDPELEEEMLDQVCRTKDHGRHYTCRGGGGVGEKTTFTFTLRIVSADARPGSVSVEARTDGPEGHRRIPDPRHEDDRAAVRLHVTGRAATAGGAHPAVVAWSAAAGGTALATGAWFLARRRRRRG